MILRNCRASYRRSVFSASVFSASAFVAAMALCLGACSQGAKEGAASDTSVTVNERSGGGPLSEPYDNAGLAAFRASKDSGFAAADSPLPDSLRADFKGLEYYPADSSFVFRVPLEPLPTPEPFQMMTSTGETRNMVRYGVFRFTVDGRPLKLLAYKSLSSADHLFVPFRDATNGADTYEAGRYLDLVEHPGKAPYVLDFNLAYNPYCAYNSDYSCPIVPAENLLPVAIRAGEKRPQGIGH